MFSNMFQRNVTNKEVFRTGDRVVCYVPGPHRPDKERCGVVAMTNVTRQNLTNGIVVALDYPLIKKADQLSRQIADDLMIAAEQVLVVEEKNKDRIRKTNANSHAQNDQNRHDHALFCCKSCGRIACKIDLIEFCGFLVCKAHFCPWDSVNHGPNVQEVAELYCRILDIAERARVGVLHPEAKALMFHGEYLQVLARARNREADAGQDLLRFFIGLFQRDLKDIVSKLQILPKNNTVTKRWRFEFLQDALVGQEFLPFFHSLEKLVDLKTSLSLVPNTVPVASSDILRLNVICLDLAKPDNMSIELRAGSNFTALWKKLTSLKSFFRRQEFEVFVVQGNEPLLYDQQPFCLPLEETQMKKGDIVYRLGMNSLADKDTVHLVKKELVAISPPQLLCALIGDFPFNNSLVQKTNSLATCYQGFRRIRGDGNCYYRAVMFSFVEQVLSQAEPYRGELLNGFVETLRTLGGQESLVEYFDRSEAKEHLTVRDFLIDLIHRKPKLDLELVSAAKALLTKFIIENRDFEANGMRLEDAMMSYYDNKYTTLKECCRESIEEMGECAEGAFVNLGLLFTVLRCRGALVKLDDRNQPIDIIFHEPPQASSFSVHLLFRPGHYDLLYPFAATTFQDLQTKFSSSVSSPLSAPSIKEPSSAAPLLGSADDNMGGSPSESCDQNLSGISGIKPVCIESLPKAQVSHPESISKTVASDDSVKNIRLRSVWNSSMAKNPVFIAKSSSIEDLPAEKKMRVSATQFVEMLSNPSAKLKMPHDDVNVLEIDDLRLVIPSSHALVALNLPFAWPTVDSTSSTAFPSASASAGCSTNKGTVARKLCLVDLSTLQSVQVVEEELCKQFDRQVQISNATALQELYQRANRERWPPREIDVEEIAIVQDEIKETDFMPDAVRTVRLRSVWDSFMADNPVFIADSADIDDLPSPRKLKIHVDKFPEILSNPSEKLKMPHNDVIILEAPDLHLVIPSSHALVALNLPFAWSTATSSSSNVLVSVDTSSGAVARKLCLLDLLKMQSAQTVATELSKHFGKKVQIVNTAVLEELLHQPINRERWPPREIELKEDLQNISMRMEFNGARKVVNVSSNMSFDDFWQKVTTAFNLAFDQILPIVRKEDGRMVDATSFENCFNEALADSALIVWNVMGCVSCYRKSGPLVTDSHPRFFTMSCNDMLCGSCVNEVFDGLEIDSMYNVRAEGQVIPLLKDNLEVFCPCCSKRWTDADALKSHRNERDFNLTMQIEPVTLVSLKCHYICGNEKLPLEEAFQLGCDHFMCLECVGGSVTYDVNTAKGQANPSKIVCQICKDGQRDERFRGCFCLYCNGGMPHVITSFEMKALVERGAIEERVLHDWEQVDINIATAMDPNSKKRYCHCGCFFFTSNNYFERKLECPYQCGYEMCAECGNDYHEGKCEHVGIPKEDFPRECERCNVVGLIPSDCMHITCECKHEFCFLCAAPHRPSVAHSTAYHRRGCSLFGEFCCEQKCRQNGATHCAEAKYLPGPCDQCVSAGKQNTCQHSDWKPCSVCVRDTKVCTHNICSECKRLGRSCDFPSDTKNGEAYEFFDYEAVINRQKELKANP